MKKILKTWLYVFWVIIAFIIVRAIIITIF